MNDQDINLDSVKDDNRITSVSKTDRSIFSFRKLLRADRDFPGAFSSLYIDIQWFTNATGFNILEAFEEKHLYQKNHEKKDHQKTDLVGFA